MELKNLPQEAEALVIGLLVKGELAGRIIEMRAFKERLRTLCNQAGYFVSGKQLRNLLNAFAEKGLIERRYYSERATILFKADSLTNKSESYTPIIPPDTVTPVFMAPQYASERR